MTIAITSPRLFDTPFPRLGFGMTVSGTIDTNTINSDLVVMVMSIPGAYFTDRELLWGWTTGLNGAHVWTLTLDKLPPAPGGGRPITHGAELDSLVNCTVNGMRGDVTTIFDFQDYNAIFHWDPLSGMQRDAATTNPLIDLIYQALYREFSNT